MSICAWRVGRRIVPAVWRLPHARYRPSCAIIGTRIQDECTLTPSNATPMAANSTRTAWTLFRERFVCQQQSLCQQTALDLVQCLCYDEVVYVSVSVCAPIGVGGA